MSAGYGQDRVQVGRDVAEVHRHYRERAVGDERVEHGRVEGERVVDGGDHGHPARPRDRVDAADERQRGDDHLGAGRHTEPDQRARKRGRAGGHCDGVTRTDRAGEVLLEAVGTVLEIGPVVPEQRARAHDLERGLHLVRTPQRKPASGLIPGRRQPCRRDHEPLTARPVASAAARSSSLCATTTSSMKR